MFIVGFLVGWVGWDLYKGTFTPNKLIAGIALAIILAIALDLAGR